MLRNCGFYRQALPFVPMALTTIDALESKMQHRGLQSHKTSKKLAKNGTTIAPLVSSSGNGIRQSSTSTGSYSEGLEWFTGQSLMFVSPKHDGIRLLSYASGVTDTTEGQRRNPPVSASGCSPEEGPDVLPMTCYSRQGRPIRGVLWIEEELQLLRWLCGDPHLVLDGELYLHRVMEGSGAYGRSIAPTGTHARRHKGDKGNVSPPRTGVASDGFHTGFLAVSALVHRLRGSAVPLSTEEVWKYVSSLPQYCVFDVPSYHPPSLSYLFSTCHRPDAASSLLQLTPPLSPSMGARVERERYRIWKEVMHSYQLGDPEQLRVIPNVTPFSQRLRTMHILFSVLKLGVQSPLLARQLLKVNASRVKGSVGSTAVDVALTYNGGRYVQLIPHCMAHSLQQVKEMYLSTFIKRGYEGAVLRSPANIYEMAEKKRGTVRLLVAPMDPMEGRGALHARGHRTRRAAQSHLTGEAAAKSPPAATVEDGEKGNNDDARFVQLAVQRIKHLPKRSTSVVKVLPFRDREFPILRPLLKAPSSNPRTRKLVSVTPSHSCKGFDASSMKATHGRAKNRVTSPKEPLVFYGLQCLADTGKVFNVSLPKMTLKNQEALLQHLMSVSTNKCGSRRSLTGLYVTVKFASLTEHGTPRFATVKAIRGGKGWFL